MNNKNKFDILQCFRGLAAFGVVLNHSSLSTNSFVHTIPLSVDSFIRNGFVGVDFFFVLSGFIILSSHFNDDRNFISAKNYLIKRVVRIYPPYIPVSAILFFSYVLFPNISAGSRGHISFISSFFLIPDMNPPALSVAWTLIHEMLFYVIFMLFYLSRRFFILFLVVWSVSIFCFMYFGWSIEQTAVGRYLLAPINIEFIAGMGVAFLVRNIRGGILGAPLVAFGIFLLALLFCLGFNEQNRFVFSVPFSLLVLGSVLLESRFNISAKLKIFIRLGDASYGIYLIHNPFISIVSRIISHFQYLKFWWISVVVDVLSSIIFGFIYHCFVEKPITSYLRKIAFKKN